MDFFLIPNGRNNRAVLFNFTCEMVFHLMDMIVAEDAKLAMRVKLMHDRAREKDVVNESGNIILPRTDDSEEKAGRLYEHTTRFVTKDIIDVGSLFRRKIQSMVCRGPNGMHFINMVLFSCLLPTVGFHVLSRTGHTDIMDAF